MDPVPVEQQQEQQAGRVQGDPAALLQALWQSVAGLEGALQQLGQSQAALGAAAPAPTANRPSKPPKPNTFSGDRTDARSSRAWVYQVNNYYRAASPTG